MKCFTQFEEGSFEWTADEQEQYEEMSAELMLEEHRQDQAESQA